MNLEEFKNAVQDYEEIDFGRCLYMRIGFLVNRIRFKEDISVYKCEILIKAKKLIEDISNDLRDEDDLDNFILPEITDEEAIKFGLYPDSASKLLSDLFKKLFPYYKKKPDILEISDEELMKLYECIEEIKKHQKNITNPTNFSEFENHIEEQEKNLLGIKLFQETCSYQLGIDSFVMMCTADSFNNVIERCQKGIDEAKELLVSIKTGNQSIEKIYEFNFPPIKGMPGLDDVYNRAMILVDVFKEKFPNIKDISLHNLSDIDRQLFTRICAERFSFL